MVREEAGQSTSAALGQNTTESLKNKIRRQQAVLYLENEWPHMRVEREVVLQAGSRYYNFPSDLSPDHRIDAVHVFYEDEWRPVEYGISLGHYNELNPEADERRDPVLLWDVYEGEQFEVWPLPEANGTRLLLRGSRKLGPLLADSDVADLDDRLISLFVAAELVARQNQRDSEAMLAIARTLLTRLKGQQSRKRVFSKSDAQRYQNGKPGYHRPGPMYGKKL